MRVSIRHEIVQEFSPPARTAIQLLRLNPRDCESQHVAKWHIGVDIDCNMRSSEDVYGNIVQTLDADGPIKRLVISARGEVDTFDTAGVLRGHVETAPIDLYLRETDLTAADPALRAFARASVKEAKTDLDRPHSLMRAAHEIIKIKTDETDYAPSAAEVFARKEGGATDAAHVFIAAARAVGIPARCVSGYLLPEAESLTEIGRKGSTGATPHIWAEAYVERLGWIGFDPALCLCMYEGHVRLANGPDYLAVAPLRVAPLVMGKREVRILVEAAQGMAQRQM